MGRYEPKTKATDASVRDWLAAIEDEARRKDCATAIRLMKRVTKAEPRLWGARDGADRYPKQLAKLGRHKLGKSCLYLKGLDGVDLAALEELLTLSVRNMRSRAACS